ncbi:Glycosyltransferase involved in cell wall bisynthesis [Spirosomataceae bacterium TFI 002]|nr:Glycosyltransferase involved in cell wall bisynthesis [Spirosomataceae bacterium TFI 002]
MPKSLLLVVPCYNEEEILLNSFDILEKYLNGLIAKGLVSDNSKVCMVDDGSKDNTWQIIGDLCAKSPLAASLKLSKNFGHQSAVLAGLLETKDLYDFFITIDADLQDDIAVIEEMVIKHSEGAKVVYGVRNDRTSDSFFKRFTAESFYTLMLKMGVPVIHNHADFRLMDKIVINELESYKEVNLFLRGIIPTIGFKSEKVFYARKEREAGESKYPLSKMLAFAWNGITSFSTTPMRIVLWFGFFNFLLALGITVYVIASKIMGTTVQGWTSTLLPMAYFSGSNMIAIGLVGEYLGKVYQEIKARPRYIIEERKNLG